MGNLCESIGLMRFAPLMSPRTQVLVSCSENEHANHTWAVFWDPPRLYLVSQVLFQGPQLVRVFIHLLSVLMPCLLSVACPGGVYISVLFRTRHDFAKRVRPVTLSGVRPVLALDADFWVRHRSTADFVAGSLVGWFPWT